MERHTQCNQQGRRAACGAGSVWRVRASESVREREGERERRQRGEREAAAVVE